MPEQIRVNIKHRINNAAIKRETRNGRDVVVVPSAVAKFDTVLNGILYPREELESSYKGLEFRYVGQFTAQAILDKDPSRLHTVTSDVCRDCQRMARKPRDWR